MARPLDTGSAERKVWLVKVPNFLAQEWDTLFQQEIEDLKKLPADQQKTKAKKQLGKIQRPPKRLSGSQSQQDEMTLILEDELAKDRLPKRYRLTQHTGELPKSHVLSEHSEKYAIEGKISQQYDVQAAIIDGKIDPKYMEMIRQRRDKVQSKMNNKENKIEVQTQMESARTKFIPLDKVNLNKKKDAQDNKRGRMDRHKLTAELFKMFEVQNRLTMAALQARLNQPLQYLKEIVNEIAIQNKKGPYKGLWEVKKELKNSNFLAYKDIDDVKNDDDDQMDTDL